MSTHKLPYPWLTILAMFCFSCYLYLASQPQLIRFYRLDAAWFTGMIPMLALIGLFLIVLLEMHLYHRRVQKYRDYTSQQDQQIRDLLLAKKALQTKAHTFSGHADKLKLFISDRLLEYLEYDEKFLHFKSIASEIRHNGVICFDKVQTALTQAGNRAPEAGQSCQDAQQAMIYLWDLLDLSTADNLALHISSQLCDVEEHYYQMMLKENIGDEDQGGTSGPALPAPLFSSGTTILKALDALVEKLLRFTDDEISDGSYEYEDNTFRIRLACNDDILGNENHIVLLLENLINNALFYFSKKPSAQKHMKIAIHLEKQGNNIIYSIYNPGNHIPDDEKDQIFQLGFSTRRVREHHGKGLGLYFVNEISRGYDGHISFENIHNKTEIYSIRIAYADGSLVSEVVETVTADGKVLCLRPNDEKTHRQVEWSNAAVVESVEISIQSGTSVSSFNDFPRQNNAFLDSEEFAAPRWRIGVIQRKRSSKVTFTPMDITGVSFRLLLPTAESRLNHEADSVIEDSNAEAELETLKQGLPRIESLTG